MLSFRGDVDCPNSATRSGWQAALFSKFGCSPIQLRVVKMIAIDRELAVYSIGDRLEPTFVETWSSTNDAAANILKKYGSARIGALVSFGAWTTPA